MLDFNVQKLLPILFALMIMFLGYWIAKGISSRVALIVKKHMSKHESVICQRLIFYGLMLIFLIAALQQLGFKLGVLLGAAGVFTVGVGFAAQTSLANLISGLFLLMERPFKIGDTITAKGYTGVVDSIDLLSTRLCTSDGTLVRIPNENIMQAEIINLSYFPKRRIDIPMSVDYKTDIDKAKAVLFKLVKDEPLALPEPPPQLVISTFGSSAINLIFEVWVTPANYSNVKNDLQNAIKVAFYREEINMSFPQVMLHSVTEGSRKKEEKTLKKTFKSPKTLDTDPNSA